MPEIIEEISHTASFAANFLHQVSIEGHTRPKITFPLEEVLRIETLIEQIYDEFQNKNLASGEIIKIYTALLTYIAFRESGVDEHLSETLNNQTNVHKRTIK